MIAKDLATLTKFNYTFSILDIYLTKDQRVNPVKGEDVDVWKADMIVNSHPTKPRVAIYLWPLTVGKLDKIKELADAKASQILENIWQNAPAWINDNA